MSYRMEQVPINQMLEKYNTGLDAIKRAPIVHEDTGIKCLRIQDISQKKDYKNWGNTKVTPNDYRKFQLKKNYIMVARTGASIGVMRLIDKDYKSVFNNGLIRLIPNELIVDPQYLFYNLISDQCKNHIYGISAGTATQPNMKMGDLLNYEINLPSLSRQKAIANILSSLDDKIELNNKINKNLQELAQTLYKRWFVDFEFPNEDGEPYKSSGGEVVESELGLIPKGWIIENVTNLFVFKGGSQPPKEEHIYEHREGYVRFIQNRDYKEETRHLTFIKESPRNKTAEKLDILMDKYGEVGQIRYGIEGAYNVALAKIDPINSKNLELLRGYFSQDSIREYLSNSSIASTRGSLNATTFTGLKIAYTESEIKEAYSEFQTYILLKILKNKEQNKKISQIRDELLPKLMNGKIEVPIEE